jgi:hypothetical protein
MMIEAKASNEGHQTNGTWGCSMPDVLQTKGVVARWASRW